MKLKKQNNYGVTWLKQNKDGTSWKKQDKDGKIKTAR